MSFAVLLRALVLFVIATPIFTLSPRVTTPDSFEYVFKDESVKLIKVDDGPVRELKDISTGVYSLKLAATRAGCGPKVGAEEYLGFNNRTCTSSLVPGTRTAGPVMRGPSSSMLWREWMVTVKNKGDDRVDVSLQSFVHPALEDQGKCLGYVSNYYGNPKAKGSCVIPPYGNGLFLDGTENTASKVSNNPQVLSMKAAGEGEFEITAANKPGECARALAVEDCDGHAVLVEDPVEYFADTQKYTTWILTKRYDVVVSGASQEAIEEVIEETPQAMAPSPRTPPPPAPIPGPRIEPSIYGQTIVTSGLIEVSVKSTGGNTACSVESITFTAVNTATGESASTPAYNVANLQQLPATVPLTGGYLYEVYAVGTCSNGGVTEKSNVLSITSSSPAASPPPPIDWMVVPSPGAISCTAACASLSKTCNQSGMRAVDSLAKGLFVLNLLGEPAPASSDGTSYIDAPALSRFTFFWNGASSDCARPGSNRRICCCGSNCPVQ